MHIIKHIMLTFNINFMYKFSKNLRRNVSNSYFGKPKDNTVVTALDCVSTDLSSVTPYFPKTFNLASYVNHSETLQKLLQLNVNLSKIEKKLYIVENILKLDFKNDVKNHILFLQDFVELDVIGEFITKNPQILCEPLEDLKVRINYLQSKHFNDDQVKRIITRNPFWLMFSTTRIDKRLGYFQNKFGLCGEEVRSLSCKQPKIITYNLHNINTNTFVLKEEMGFEEHEMKNLILAKPKIWMLNQRTLRERFNYIHNEIHISHKTILQFPSVLLCRTFRLKQRHLFLEKLGRAQYNPKLENYVPIMALIEDTDTEFCKKYAKCNVKDFNTFLKTL